MKKMLSILLAVMMIATIHPRRIYRQVYAT